MKSTLALAAAGFVLLAGAALADPSVRVEGNLKTPLGEYPVENEITGIPVEDGELAPPGAHEQANGALAEHGVPAEVQFWDGAIRVNVRCDASLPGQACIRDEPPVPVPQNDLASVDGDGLHLTRFVSVSSRDAVLRFLPDQVPEEQRAQLLEANEAVNADVEAAVEESTPSRAAGLRFRAPGASISAEGRLSDLLAGLGIASTPLGEGNEAPWTPEGFDEHFERDAPGFQSLAGERGHGIAGESQGTGDARSAGLGAAVLAAAAVGGLVLAPAALYHRIRANHTLRNRTRQAVYDAVVQQPGLGVNDAAKAAGCSYSTAAYHLERLVEERLLIASQDGRRTRYFKNGGAFSPQEREFVPVLQNREAMRVLEVIVGNPWCYRAEIAQRLGVSGPTVNWHLRRLMRVGVVKEMREGRVSYLYADRRLLAQLGANLVGKVPEDLVARLSFERRAEPEVVEPALPAAALPGEGLEGLEPGTEGIEITPLPEPSS